MSVSIGAFDRATILTGAGFSRNWGGLLASEFFGRLIGHGVVRGNQSLHSLLLQETNFEAALHTARSQGFSAADVNALEQAILDVYLDHDSAIRGATFTGPSDINIYGVRDFLSRFFGQSDTGYLFTLNQDLLLERIYYPPTNPDRHVPRPSLPGVPSHGDWFTTVFYRNGLPPDYIRQVPSATVVPPVAWPPPLSGCFNYVKLHGSFDWRDPSGSRLLVIGGGKAQSIAASPLLNWYSDVFRSVCLADDVRILVSGYSFSDEHINEILADGVKNAGLRIFIHNTIPVAEMQGKLSGIRYGSDIWSGLIGYSMRPLIEIFPGTQQRTHERATIEQMLFV